MSGSRRRGLKRKGEEGREWEGREEERRSQSDGLKEGQKRALFWNPRERRVRLMSKIDMSLANGLVHMVCYHSRVLILEQTRPLSPDDPARSHFSERVSAKIFQEELTHRSSVGSNCRETFRERRCILRGSCRERRGQRKDLDVQRSLVKYLSCKHKDLSFCQNPGKTARCRFMVSALGMQRW